jgi:hypothetical protein
MSVLFMTIHVHIRYACILLPLYQTRPYSRTFTPSHLKLPGSTKVFISHNTRLMLDIGSCDADILLGLVPFKTIERRILLTQIQHIIIRSGGC